MSSGLDTVSRDPHLALRRVGRQQRIIERLHASRRRLRLHDLAHSLQASERTVARDVSRLRMSGIPVDVTPGRTGGFRLDPPATVEPIQLDLPEIAALVSSPHRARTERQLFSQLRDAEAGSVADVIARPGTAARVVES